ncbi:CRISPR-associated endonuclease Cas3'' [Saccharopolyspora gregorii]|uniref:CRISPR-associated endonuclease Cas3'' n=1 Tax=Saccharopolyspora gregorii TaxID=33914 RepID=UPI003CD0857F
MVDLRLWGKERGLGRARYPVVCHGLDAAAAMRALWRDFVSAGLGRRLAAELGLSESETCSVLEFWTALHDIGKISPSFALQLPMPPEFPADAAEVRIRHDQATNLWLPTGLGVLGYPSRSARSVGRLVAQLLGGHHGRFHSVEGARPFASSPDVRGLAMRAKWKPSVGPVSRRDPASAGNQCNVRPGRTDRTSRCGSAVSGFAVASGFSSAALVRA